MDRLEETAYNELIVMCQRDGCGDLFQPSLDIPATDPVEDWARAIAEGARSAGWSTDDDGRPLCPRHTGMA